MTSIAGIDLGGTKILGARIERTGSGELLVRGESKRPTPRAGVDDIVAEIAAMVAALDDVPEVIGIGTPGVIAPGGRVVEYAPNLAGFDRPVPLADLVAERVDAPVVIGNDVNMAALGEVRFGAAAGARDALAVWLGTGVGAGLVLDGRLRVGPSGLAGELGHVTVVPDGRACACGGRGHLEAYLGRRAMEGRARELHASGRPSALVELAGDAPMKSKVFLAAHEQGDEVAVELLDEGLALLGVAVANLVVTVDVTVVVIGGGLGERLGDLAVDRLGRSLAALRYASVAPEVVPASLGDHSATLGAAAHAVDTLGI